MTEAGWLASEDPQRMLEWIQEEMGSEGYYLSTCPNPVRISDRKLRLFACACLRVAGKVNSENIDEWEGEGARGAGPENPLAWAQGWAASSSPPTQPTKAHILRDLVGNSWRPVKVRAFGGLLRIDWLTPTVLSLARAAYDERQEDGTLDPFRLLLVADALEEAGCTEEALLQHLRGEERCWLCCGETVQVVRDAGAFWGCSSCNGAGWIPLRGPHYRGCWAVDLLLGKE